MGGVQTLYEVVEGLIDSVLLPIVVIQHRPLSQTPDRLTGLLQRRTALPVRTAAHGMSVWTGGITVIPGGWAATIDAEGCYRLARPCDRHRADALFASAAKVVGQRAIGVVLTGRLNDGQQGVREIKRRGGRVLVQDPTTAIAAEMPNNAIATGCVDFVLPSRRIGAALVALTVAPGGAELLAVTTPPWAALHE